MTDLQRYENAAHAMQSGVAAMMAYDPKETEPKHLRVGVNSAMVSHAALVTILMEKGLFTLEEYHKALADQMEKEAADYEGLVKSATGGGSEIHLA